MGRSIEITIVPPRRYEEVKDKVYVKFMTRLHAMEYTKEEKYEDYDLLPHLDYNVRRDYYKYWRVYTKKRMI